MAFHAKTDADVHADRWEVHPAAEEIVSCPFIHRRPLIHHRLGHGPGRDEIDEDRRTMTTTT
ncbi:hypothetical protein AB0H64_44090, partial [Nonomuraea sp. NPDC050733]